MTCSFEPAFLVFDRDPVEGHLIRDMLAPLAPVVNVCLARAAMDALDRRQDWCALFIDAGVPTGEGFDVLEHARCNGCESPAVIFVRELRDRWLLRARKARAVPLDVVDRECIEQFGALALDSLRHRKVPFATWLRNHGLTKAEARVLAAALLGLSHKEIQSDLGISENTMKKHSGSVARKVGTGRLAQAALKAASETEPPESGPRLVRAQYEPPRSSSRLVTSAPVDKAKDSEARWLDQLSEKS